ncbi:T9SS type A sorting domain-containing protein [Psychroserpens sp. XS_ASV72]|uniref:T9SS type A sorting domain-containing protein n=1 Tax=Psychroserpens sp. XS_ASV72 TaxID=3241293 RepID=UPI003519A92F
MKNFYILLMIFATSAFCVDAQTLGTNTFSLGEDNADNYGGSWTTTNQGIGFSDWTFDTALPNGGFAGRFIGSFSSALDVNGNSFGMFANSGNGAVSGARVDFPQSMQEGDSFTVSIGVNFRDGNKGFDLRDSSNSTIINLNVGSDQYNITGTSGLFSNAYDSNTVFTCTFTQNASDVSWTVVRSGGLSGTQSGTISSISPGTIDNIRFYNVSAGTNGDGGSGQRNLYLNSLQFNSLYTIDGNATASASGDTTVPYLTIQSGSTLNIPSNSSVTVSGDLSNSGTLNLTSTSTQYPSLIVNGSSTGDITYNRYANSNANGNDLVSAPVSGQSWADFLTDNAATLLDDGNTGPTTYAFAPFNKTAGAYENYTDATSVTLTSGTGYRAATDAGATLAYTGSVQTGTVSIDIQNSGPEFAQWNLVGNPYASYINVQDFLTHEVDTGVTNLNLLNPGTAAIYGYDGDVTDGWTIYNLATTTASTVITPGQGFFVSANSANVAAYDLEFTTAMQSTGTSDDFIAGRQGGLIYMTLNMSTATDSYNTDVYFNPNASLGFDLGFDAEFFANPPAFALYSLLVEEDEGEPISLQAVHTDDLADVTIPLGANASQGEQLTFTMAVNSLPVTTEVFLEDIVESTITLLNTGDYVFTPSTTISGTGRFFLRVTDDTLSTSENNLENAIDIRALNDTNAILVRGQINEETVLNLYDIQGRIVLSTPLDTNTLYNRIDVSNLNGGVYVANVSNNNQTKTKKVILK